MNNIVVMPLLPNLSSWFGSVAEEHILKSWNHVLVHPYEINNMEIGPAT